MSYTVPTSAAIRSEVRDLQNHEECVGYLKRRTYRMLYEAWMLYGQIATQGIHISGRNTVKRKMDEAVALAARLSQDPGGALEQGTLPEIERRTIDAATELRSVATTANREVIDEAGKAVPDSAPGGGTVARPDATVPSAADKDLAAAKQAAADLIDRTKSTLGWVGIVGGALLLGLIAYQVTR